MINSDTISTTDSDQGKSPATEPAVEEIKADLKPVDQSSSPVNEPEQGSEANVPNRESSLTRRALLHKAGWAVPVILAVGLPSTVLAGITSPSGRHDHKPNHHFDNWPKKNHWPDSDKKHWPDSDKKHWPDSDKTKSTGPTLTRSAGPTLTRSTGPTLTRSAGPTLTRSGPRPTRSIGPTLTTKSTGSTPSRSTLISTGYGGN